MNEFNYNNEEFTCRACLKVDLNVQTMSYEEIIWYRKLVPEILCTQQLRVCAVCHHLLRKCIKFYKQCQQAAYLYNKTVQVSTPLTWLASFKTATRTHYLGPDFEEDLHSVTEEYLDLNSDDDVPLLMLKEERDRDISQKEINIQSLENKNHSIHDENHVISEVKKGTEAKSSKKKKKELKEGFTSRMVQETDQYVVIKLTKEQVLQELQEKRESEQYQRAPFKCERCAKGFNFEDVIRTHLEKHTKQNGEFECDICGQWCPSAVSLRGHIKSHTTRYKCKLCGAVRLSRQHLLEHHAAHTGQAALYRCQNCRFTTLKRTMMQRHVKRHGRAERHECELCGRLYGTRESLRVHTARHRSGGVVCGECGRRFLLPSLLRAHVLHVHTRTDYYCVECDTAFKSPDNLRLHFKKAKRHRDSSSYTSHCGQCPARFVSAASLAAHLASAHGHPKSFPCHVCYRLYSSRESLKCHIRRVHVAREAARHVCHICKKSFSRKSVLILHTKTHHEPELEEDADAVPLIV